MLCMRSLAVIGQNMVLESDKNADLYACSNKLQDNLVQTCSLGYNCADKSPLLLWCLSTQVTIINCNVAPIANKTPPTCKIDDYTIATVNGIASLLGPILNLYSAVHFE